GVLGPIVDGQHGRNSDCIDPFASSDQIGVVFVSEFRQSIEIGELLRIRNRQDVQAGIGRHSWRVQDAERLLHHAQERVVFAFAKLLESPGNRAGNQLDVDAKPLKQKDTGDTRRASGVDELNPFTAQLLDAGNVVARDQMDLGDWKAQQILDALVKVRKLRLGAEILEEVDLGDGDVNAAQIEQILEVRGRAARHDRQDPHLVTVIDDSSDLLGEAHERPIEHTADETHGPCVL